MRETVFQKTLCLLLCAVLLVGLVPLHTHAEALSPEQCKVILNRRMESWCFPLPEEYYGSIVDFSGCLGTGTDALLGIENPTCVNYNHESSVYGGDGLAVSVPAWVEVYAPVGGTLYRSAQPDGERGNVAVIEQTAGNGYSYYLVLGGLSEDQLVQSGSAVAAETPIGYTAGGELTLSAVMDVSGSGARLADNASAELGWIGAMGWLTEAEGTGMICVNPSRDTASAYGNALTAQLLGPITYTFVTDLAQEPGADVPIEFPTEPIEEYPTEHTQHTWDGGTVTLAPTHTTPGEIVYTCYDCGQTTTESIAPSAEHVYDQQVASDAYLCSPASCYGPATYYYSCVCGAAGTETFPYGDGAGDHTWNAGEVIQAPTHTASGLVRYTCTTCGTTRDETISASADHVYDQQVASDAYLAAPGSCTSPARYYYSCLCGAAGTETFQAGDTTGHSWNAGEIVQAPTHTASGLQRYTCTVCGATRDETLEASADHVFDQEVVEQRYLAVAATCSNAAIYYKSCLCGAVGTETFDYGNPAPHTYSDQWSHNETDHWRSATCIHSGEATDLGPHKWDDGVITKNAGHNEDGEKRYTCTVCGATRTEVLPGQPHEFNQAIAEKAFRASKATCTSPATYYYSCVCGLAGTQTFTAGEAKGHTFSDQWSHNELQHWMAATCEHTDQKIKVADHIWNPGQITTQPTATSKGVMTYTCSVCGATKTEEVAPSQHQHTYSTAWAGNATYHWHPATCEHTNVVGSLGEHQWNEGVITAWPSHNAAGQKTFTCAVCGQSKTESIAQTHTYDQQNASAAFLASNATCTSAATYYYSCSCGAKDTTRTFTSGSALGHTASGTYGKDANYHWNVCSRCGAKGELIAHSFGSNEACTVCGYAKQDSHIHSSHLSRVPAKAATCTQPGNISYYICDCGMWFTDVTTAVPITDQQTVVQPALGHVDKDNNGRCDVCKERMDSTVEYQMTEGAESTWLNTSNQGMVFRSNADYGKFDHLEVDGATVAVTNYSVSQGSTIVELNASYLRRLSLGRHTLTIVAKDGRASTGFTIKQGASGKTEGGSNTAWGLILLLTVVVAIAIPVTFGVFYYRKKTGHYNR